MPITWFHKHRSALALSLFFPWFPPVPVSLPTEPPAVAEEAVARAPEEPLVLPGVVIEEIPKGSALEKAGLQVGDVILSWERLPNPPANPEGARGEVNSYFDWVELEVEQVPRGAVVLRGRRVGEVLELRVEPGFWEVKARPVLSRAIEEIYLTGKAQIDLGEIDAAVRDLEALAGDEELWSWLSLQIGDAWRRSGEWERAIDAYREGIRASRNSSGQFRAWIALGSIYESRNDYDLAKQAYLSALEVGHGRPEGLGLMTSLTHLGLIAWKQGLLDLAQDYFLRSLELCKRFAPESLEAAESLNNLGAVTFARGDISRAREFFLRTVQIRERLAPRSSYLAISLNNLGVVARESGDLVSADDYLVQALQIHESVAPQSLETASSLENLAGLSLDRGRIDVAYSYYLRALQIQQQLAPDGVDVANTLNSLGIVNQRRGSQDRAREYHLRALRIQEQLSPRSLGVATSLNNLGTVAKDQGDLRLARRYFLQALDIERELAPEGLRAAISLGNLGAVAHASGELDLAHDYYLQALRIEERLAPQSLNLAASLSLLGDLEVDREKFDGAQKYFLRALAIREKIAPGSLFVAASLMGAGDVARALGESEDARSYYLRALDALEKQVSRLGGSYGVEASFRAQYRGFYSDALSFLIAQSQFYDAFHVLERFRAQTLLTMLVERDMGFALDVPEELDRERRRLGIQYDRTLKRLSYLNARDQAEEIEVARRELQRLEDEAGDVEAMIRQTSPRLAALKYPRPHDPVKARQALDPGTLLLSYRVGKEESTLFSLSPSGALEVKILPLGEEALRSRLKQFLDLISEARLGSSAVSSIGEQRRLQLQNASRDLYTALLGPVAERIAQSDRLLILPDGPLHVLPFGALIRDDGADGQYLAEWKPIHIALSATVFAELKQRRRPANDRGSIQLAAFGDPVYPQSLTKADRSSGDPVVRSAAERGIFDWQPLPYTRHEVEGIARLFPEGSARTFLGPEALEEKIKSLDPKTRILHLAAHGYTDEHLPSSSFVALTIPEDSKPDDTRDNGLLQVWEIFERVRIDADLVVLSACDTGLGKELGGEGLIGLTRAFQYAGARTVMASLWSIQDRATAELMIRFYKHLRAGLPKDEALRQAQIELMRGPIEVVNEKGEKVLFDASAPYYWAGIQVYGDWQ